MVGFSMSDAINSMMFYINQSFVLTIIKNLLNVNINDYRNTKRGTWKSIPISLSLNFSSRITPRLPVRVGGAVSGYVRDMI